jgi:hypothetical protein
LPEYGRYTENDKFCNFRYPVSELVILPNDTQKYDPDKIFFRAWVPEESGGNLNTSK